jgi:transcriptional regulator with XRE-family HTH domain
MLLRDYMISAQLSDSRMASMLGATKSAVSHWRRGDRIPGRAQMAAIARATGGLVTANDFYAQHDASSDSILSPAGDALAEPPSRLGQLPSGASASAPEGFSPDLGASS